MIKTRTVREPVTDACITISRNCDGIKVNGKIEKIDEAYFNADRLFMKIGQSGELIIQSSRGNLLGWKDITAQWKRFRNDFQNNRMPEELKAMCSTMEAINENSDSTVNTDIGSIKNGEGYKMLYEKTQKKNIDENCKNAVETMEKITKSNTTGAAITCDAEEKKLQQLKNKPELRSRKNSDGSFTIANSLLDGHCYEIRVFGELNRSKMTRSVGVYIVDFKGDVVNVGASMSIPVRNIVQGGTKLTNIMQDYGRVFSSAEICNANDRLYILVMDNRLEMKPLTPYLSYSEIRLRFINYIKDCLKNRWNSSGNKEELHNEIYLEEVQDRNSEDGKRRIDVGIWQKEFEAIYKTLIDEDEVDMKMREFLKQGKALGNLIPDSGRGGGQHTPSSSTSERYGRSPYDRIQRFSFDEKELASLWDKEKEFRQLSGGKYSQTIVMNESEEK